jgi:predicted RND superfamily exporter protein
MSVHQRTGGDDRKGHAIVEFSMDRPRVVLWGAALLAVAAVLLTLGVETDTDPENMLRADHEVRVANAEMRETFGAHEMIVVGVVDDDGIATPELMTAVDELRDDIETVDGVIGQEIVSARSATEQPANLTTQAGVDALIEAVASEPPGAGNVVSEDGTPGGVFVRL